MFGLMGRYDLADRDRKPENVAFGRRLRMRRMERRLSQGQIAARFGMTNKAISGYEIGRVEFPSRLLPDLANILGVTVGYFFDEADEKSVGVGTEDREWLGYLGRRLAMLPPGPLREQYKERLREFADSEAEFVRRLSEEIEAK